VAADVFFGQSRLPGPGPSEREPGLAGCLLAVQPPELARAPLPAALPSAKTPGVCSGFCAPGGFYCPCGSSVPLPVSVPPVTPPLTCAPYCSEAAAERRFILGDQFNVFLLQFLWAGFCLQQHWSNAGVTPGGGFG